MRWNVLRAVLLSTCALSFQKLFRVTSAADVTPLQCLAVLDDLVDGRCIECSGVDVPPVAAKNCCDAALLTTCLERLEAITDDFDPFRSDDNDAVNGLYDQLMAEKRKKILFGKRGRNTFLGKRSEIPELYKKARNTFLGKRSADDEEEFDKRARNTFLGKRARNTFLGKRTSPELEIDEEKRNRNKFLGKREMDKKSRNVFLGKREDELDEEKRARNTFLGKREYSHVIEERSRNKFLGKRDDGTELEQLGNGLEKRPRNTFLGR